MSEVISPTIPIDFSDKVQKDLMLFDYTDNPLYNLSVQLFSTALTLARLPKPENLSLFKSLLKQHIVDLSEQGNQLDYPAAVIDKLCCLHCIVLDEFIIHGDWGNDAGWENNTLLSELFGLKNGGDLFFTITDKALNQAAKMQDLLQISYVFLQMGFKGRYRSRQSEQLGVITKQIHISIKHNVASIDILLKDKPQAKSLFLKNGARYFSFSLFIITLSLVFAFFDYWFKETYPLRAKEFTELQKSTAGYILNAQTKDIVYISTDEDIHAVNNLSQDHQHPRSNHASSHNIVAPAQQAVALKIKPAQFRVQLASFSSENNANKFLLGFASSQYLVSVMQVGNYFIVFSQAKDASQAKLQQQYFKDQYQVSTVLIQLDDTGN